MNNIKEIGIGIFIITIAAIGGWFMLGQSGTPAPQVSMTTIDGQTITTSDLKGGPALVVFWATDCPGCIKEMPYLVKLYDQYNAQGLSMIGIAMAHDKKNYVLAMREKKQLNYDITMDEDGTLAKAFGEVRLTPTTLLINPEGNIVFRKLGEVNFDQLENDIQQMLTSNT